MRIIDLDATNWKSWRDFYRELLGALGAPEGHGKSVNALIDSMVWGGMNKVEPPYTIRIFPELRNCRKMCEKRLKLLRHALPEACAEFRSREGRDLGIRI